MLTCSNNSSEKWYISGKMTIFRRTVSIEAHRRVTLSKNEKQGDSYWFQVW